MTILNIWMMTKLDIPKDIGVNIFVNSGWFKIYGKVKKDLKETLKAFSLFNCWSKKLIHQVQWLGNIQWVVEARVPIWQLIVKWPDYLFISDCSELDIEIIKYVNTQLIISSTRITKLFKYYFYCVVISLS